MSVPNAYPPNPVLPQGGRSVPNVALHWRDGTPTRLMRLLGEGTQCLGLRFAPTASQAALAQQLPSGLPLRIVAVGGDEPALPGLRAHEGLAAHLDARAGELCLLRPDAYLGMKLVPADADAIAAAVHTLLPPP